MRMWRLHCRWKWNVDKKDKRNFAPIKILPPVLACAGAGGLFFVGKPQNITTVRLEFIRWEAKELLGVEVEKEGE